MPARALSEPSSRVGHRRGIGRRTGSCCCRPLLGTRRCLDPCLDPFPASPTIIPDGGISPVRLEAKASPRATFPVTRNGLSNGVHTPPAASLKHGSLDQRPEAGTRLCCPDARPDRAAFAQGPFALEALPSFIAPTGPCADPAASHPHFRLLPLWGAPLPLAPSTAGQRDRPDFAPPLCAEVLRPLCRRLTGALLHGSELTPASLVPERITRLGSCRASQDVSSC